MAGEDRFRNPSYVPGSFTRDPEQCLAYSGCSVSMFEECTQLGRWYPQSTQRNRPSPCPEVCGLCVPHRVTDQITGVKQQTFVLAYEFIMWAGLGGASPTWHQQGHSWLGAWPGSAGWGPSLWGFPAAWLPLRIEAGSCAQGPQDK